MPLNFVETVKNYFSPAVTDQLAKTLNESGESVSKALSAIIPLSLGSILNIANSGKEGANYIFNMANSAALSLPAAPPPEITIKEIEIHDLISEIFGSNQSEVTDSITNFARIQNSSTSSLLSMAIPSIIGFLGKHADQYELSAIGLSGFLSSQTNNVLQALPAELSSLENISDNDFLHVSEAKRTAAKRETVTKTINEMKAAAGMNSTSFEEEEKSGGMKWLFPLILIIIVIALIWYFTKS